MYRNGEYQCETCGTWYYPSMERCKTCYPYLKRCIICMHFHDQRERCLAFHRMDPTTTRHSLAKDAPVLGSHSCVYCEKALLMPSRFPQAVSRIEFPQTVNQARIASLNGCRVFEYLFVNYKIRSVWQIFKTHLLRQCDWCDSVTNTVQHIWKSLSHRPFQLVLVAEPHTTNLGYTSISRAYLDCADRKKGPRFNAYTYTGT
jgi:hypothetical protein